MDFRSSLGFSFFYGWVCFFFFVGNCSFVKREVLVGKVRLDKSPQFESRHSAMLRNVPFP